MMKEDNLGLEQVLMASDLRQGYSREDVVLYHLEDNCRGWSSLLLGMVGDGREADLPV